MNKFNALKNSFTLGLLGTLVTTSAMAQSSLSTVAKTVNGSLQSVGDLLLGSSMVGGVGYAITGLMKVRKAADSEGRESMGPGWTRVALGGGLTALTYVISTVTGTLWSSGSASPITVGSVVLAK